MAKIEKVDGFQLTQDELEIEMGKAADPTEINAQADIISKTWIPSTKKPEHPTILLLGGFQGSGKTTVIELLSNLIVISPDEIRHNLFAQHYPFSLDFVRLVNATKFELVKRVLALGDSCVVDQALTPDRVTLMRVLLKEYPAYSLISVFLTAPEEVLKQRVTERTALPGRYKGTVDELTATIAMYTSRYGSPENGGYDVSFDSSELTPQTISTTIMSMLGTA